MRKLLTLSLLLTVFTTRAAAQKEAAGALGAAAGQQVKKEIEAQPPTAAETFRGSGASGDWVSSETSALVSRQGCTIIDADKKQTESTWDGPEFGSIEEITNCTKVYVWASDLDDRKKILKALQKDKSLTVVGTLQEAEFIISFQVGGFNTGASVVGSTIQNNTREVGRLLVVTRGQIDDSGRRHQRIVWSDTETRDFSAGISFSRPPLTNSLNHFLKDLKKARDGK